MKTELEIQDIETITQRIIEGLKPLLSHDRRKEDETIFDPKGLAEYLRVDTSWVYKQVSSKTIPYFKNGKYTRFRKRDIDKWIDAQTIRPIPPVKPVNSR